MTGTGTSRTGGPSATAAAKPVECTGEAAATIATAQAPGRRPAGGERPRPSGRRSDGDELRVLAQGLHEDAAQPELPPEARHTYSSSSRPGSDTDAARCCVDHAPAAAGGR